jgi:hypothetical protein
VFSSTTGFSLELMLNRSNNPDNPNDLEVPYLNIFYHSYSGDGPGTEGSSPANRNIAFAAPTFSRNQTENKWQLIEIEIKNATIEPDKSAPALPWDGYIKVYHTNLEGGGVSGECGPRNLLYEVNDLDNYFTFSTAVTNQFAVGGVTEDWNEVHGITLGTSGLWGQCTNLVVKAAGAVPTGATIGPTSTTDNALVRWNGTVGGQLQNSLITESDTGVLTYPDNVRQIFNPGATVAGINVGAHTADPSVPVNGDLWYDSTANTLDAYINGAVVNLGEGAVRKTAPITLTNTQFKALPTTLIEVVPAAGANTLLVFHRAAAYLQTPGGNYTNITAGQEAGLFISYGDWAVDASTFINWGGGSTFFHFMPYMDVPGAAVLAGLYPSVGYAGGALNTALKIGAWNTGDYTGGGSGNTLQLVVYYSVVTFV